jgi:hypothetical protein
MEHLMAIPFLSKHVFVTLKGWEKEIALVFSHPMNAQPVIKQSRSLMTPATV